MSYCKVIMMGRLTKSPELKSTPNGLSVCRITVAINRRYKNGENAAKEETSFIDVDAFGKTAESVAKYFDRGSEVIIEGTLKQSRWEDRNTGEKRMKVSVMMERFQFGSSPKKQGNSPREEPKSQPEQETEQYEEPPF